jgi:hypothetical protein
MRVILTYLILIMFIGGHWLADFSPHFHEETEIVTAVKLSSDARYIAPNNNSPTAPTKNFSSLIFDDCCAVSDQADAASDIHCMADHGLAASDYEAYRAKPRLSLAVSADFLIASNAVSNPFRPPII